MNYQVSLFGRLIWKTRFLSHRRELSHKKCAERKGINILSEFNMVVFDKEQCYPYAEEMFTVSDIFLG